MYVRESLLDEIDTIKEGIENIGLIKVITSDLVNQANLHSDSLENIFNPEHVTNPYKRKEPKTRDTFLNLNKAWEYAKDKLQGNEGIVDKELLEEIAKTLEPDNFSVQKGYRTFNDVRAVPTGASTLTPSSNKVEREMKKALSQINYKSRYHPVERAILAHFEIVRIHPFADGNGRTSRLIQSLILQDEGYPVAVIREEEKGTYISFLDLAIRGHKLRTSDDSLEPSKEEKLFFNYVAEKIETGLNDSILKYHKLPQHNLRIIGAKKKGLINEIKRRIGNHFKYGKNIGVVRRDKGDENSLVITGEIDELKIRNMIVQLEKNLDPKYSRFKIEIKRKK